MFSAAIKGRGEGTSPVLRKKVVGYFSKVHDFRAKHVVFCAKLPRFLGFIFSARTKEARRHSTLGEEKDRRGRIA